ncbi:MAG: Calx-beta domain-containing protein, partial [Gammaproteobacteria bacterium]
PAAPPAISFGAREFRIIEGAGALRIELPRPAGHAGPLRVAWRTVDQSARDDVDFAGSPAWRVAEAPADARSVVIFIPIMDDDVPGPDLTFLVELRQAPGGLPVGAPSRAEVTIIDDD